MAVSYNRNVHFACLVLLLLISSCRQSQVIRGSESDLKNYEEALKSSIPIELDSKSINRDKIQDRILAVTIEHLPDFYLDILKRHELTPSDLLSLDSTTRHSQKYQSFANDFKNSITPAQSKLLNKYMDIYFKNLSNALDVDPESVDYYLGLSGEGDFHGEIRTRHYKTYESQEAYDNDEREYLLYLSQNEPENFLRLADIDHNRVAELLTNIDEIIEEIKNEK